MATKAELIIINQRSWRVSAAKLWRREEKRACNGIMKKPWRIVMCILSIVNVANLVVTYRRKRQ